MVFVGLSVGESVGGVGLGVRCTVWSVGLTVGDDVGLCVGESVGGVGLGVGCSVGSILLSVAVAVGVVRGRRPRLTSISPEESPRFVDACMLIQAMRPWIMGWGNLDVGV